MHNWASKATCSIFYHGIPTYDDKRKIHDTLITVRKKVYYSFGV